MQYTILLKITAIGVVYTPQRKNMQNVSRTVNVKNVNELWGRITDIHDGKNNWKHKTIFFLIRDAFISLKFDILRLKIILSE